MSGNRIIKNIGAILLILVFSQKMGMSLYLHNWLHASKQDIAATSSASGQEVKFACGCINDFTLPFTETPELQVPVPPVLVYTPATAPVFTFPVVYKYFHSLRAPPAKIA